MSAPRGSVPHDPITFVPAEDSLAEVEGPEAAEAAEAERREAVVDPSAHGLRLDKWLVSLAPEFSRSYLQQLIEEGCVQIDARRATTASRKLQAGQRVEVELRPTPQSQAFRPEALPLGVVHEDDHVLVIDKPRDGWFIRRPGTGPAPCSTPCWRTTRAPWPCLGRASCTAWTRTRAASW